MLMPLTCRAEAQRPRARIRAVAFDLFTIFDPRSLLPVVEAAAPGRGAELALAWRTRQFEYAWIRSSAGHYADFRACTADALLAAAHELGVTLSERVRDRLVDACSALAPWPDSAAALAGMRDAGLRLVTLTNYTPAMTSALLRHAGLHGLFEHQLSTDRVRQYKPHPKAYQLGVDALGLAREHIAFSAFGPWDAAGATWFGYPTFWVNRLGIPMEPLASPTATGPSLDALAAWITATNA